MTITLYFEQGTNPDIAQVQVQNKLQLAMPLLPQEVQQQGMRVAKATRNFLVVVGFVSTDGSMTAATTSPTTSPPTCRTRSAARPASATISCSAPSTRCASGSTRPSSTTIGLTPDDVATALQAQNVQVAAGRARRPARRSRASG